MTRVLITVDTELSAGRQAQGMGVEENLARSFHGLVDGRPFGVEWLMDRMDERGLTGCFFVDPMPGLVHGREIVARMVEPILRRGHEVQLHIHTEWLDWARESPVEGRTGRNIGDFALGDQIALIGWAREALIAAGAPAPLAFRAGNYGANDDTLRALATLGLRWDSSFNADYAGRGCAVSAPRGAVDPVVLHNVWEAPVAGLWDRPGHFRPAQVCALSAWEMRAALTHAATSGTHSFVIVTHSFEMLSRDRRRPNGLVMRRFEALCDAVAAGLATSDFATLPVPDVTADRQRLAPHRLRTWHRMAEQAVAGLLYERQLRPA